MLADDPSKSLMTVEVEIGVTNSPDKLVWLPTATGSVAMGMHDELASFYGAAPGGFTPNPSTLDYVVGALAACLAGTFKRALVARGIALDPDDLKTSATGRIVVDAGVPKIESVQVSYVLRGLRGEDRVTAERAHSVHHRGCAVSRSLEGAFAIATDLTFKQ